MSIFFKGKEVEAVLFSPLEGKITYQDKPAAGAKIKLWIAWKDEKGETEFYYADEQGNFSIPKKTVTYRENPLAQLSVGQEITVEYQGKEILGLRGIVWVKNRDFIAARPYNSSV